jgi:hypothetical protein
MPDDLSLLELAYLAEEYAWGGIELTESEREWLRRKLIDRFNQVEALNRARGELVPPKPAGQKRQGEKPY